jgi:hypothetical protein
MFMTDNGERKKGSFIVFLCVFAAVSGLGRSAVLPKMEARYYANQMEAALLSNPVFAALKKYDLTAYSSLTTSLKRSVAEGKSQRQLIDQGINVTLGIMKKKVAQASDESALQFMSSYSQVLDKVQDKDLDACYYMTRPSAGNAVDVSQYTTPQQLEALYQAMAEIIRTASTSPQSIPFDSEMKSSVDPIANELIRLYGVDVLMLISPDSVNRPSPASTLKTTAPLPDKRRICQMEAAWLRLILKQAPAEAGKLMRYMASKS